MIHRYCCCTLQGRDHKSAQHASTRLESVERVGVAPWADEVRCVCACGPPGRALYHKTYNPAYYAVNKAAIAEKKAMRARERIDRILCTLMHKHTLRV